MDSLDKVRARQKSAQEKAKSGGAVRKTEASNKPDQAPGTRAYANTGKKRKRKKQSKLNMAIKIAVLVLMVFVIFCGIWLAVNIDFSFGDNLSSLNLNLSSTVYYIDEDGNPKRFEQFQAAENRIWVSIDKIPKHLQDAFVAIEDQRFYKHHGVDLKRTTGAVLNYVLKGDSSYGGSTITQQLVKNITNDRERSKTRKIREMVRSVLLESKVSKEQILEMYLNTIYLSQGANGVEAAANEYFAKDVSKLTLAESACIAGITQYPATYDPILNPENNEKKRKTILKKMLELKFINEEEYTEAVNTKLEFHQGKERERGIQSYFLDHLFEVLLDDLIEKGYSEQFATNMIYNGGLKIYSTVDPEVQRAMEDVFEDDSSFPRLGGSKQPQSAMVVSDPQTGEVKGIVGGRGKKDGNRVLNRVTQTTRQPGSSIKPIAVYAPAIDLGIVNLSTNVEDSPIEIGGWKPKNYSGGYRGWVSVRSAVAHSYNIPAVRVLEEVTVEESFRYLKDKLKISTLVSSETKNGKTYTDKNLSSLALGGLTNGVTVMDMNAAYCAFANDGIYTEPSVYTKVYDADGRILLEKEPQKSRAFSEETAYLTNLLLKGVVTGGTGGGAQISNIDTCGKTGTTDDDKDRWFIGYTPYYVGSVWFGYDTPKTISYGGTNPALAAWKKVMTKIHKPLAAKHFTEPDGVERMSVCQATGKKPSSTCSVATEYVNKKFAKQQCSGVHGYIGTKTAESYYEELENEEEENSENENGETDENTSDGSETTQTPDNDTLSSKPTIPVDDIPTIVIP